MKWSRGRPVQQRCFSIEDDIPRRARDGWVSPRSELAVVRPASLINDPESESRAWRVGKWEEKGVL